MDSKSKVLINATQNQQSRQCSTILMGLQSVDSSDTSS